MSDGAVTLTIVREAPEHFDGVRRVHELAFGRPDEARLVEALRARGAVTLSLVALQSAEVVGHLLLSPVAIHAPTRIVPAVGLGPMGVLPASQRRGIGSRLILQGLEDLRAAGHGAVVVLGHPGYYPRFGFRPASRFGLTCKWPVRDDVFMALELVAGALGGAAGRVDYEPELDAV